MFVRQGADPHLQCSPNENKDTCTFVVSRKEIWLDNSMRKTVQNCNILSTEIFELIYSGASHSKVNPFRINLRYAEASLNGAGISIGMH